MNINQIYYYATALLWAFMVYNWVMMTFYWSKSLFRPIIQTKNIKNQIMHTYLFGISFFGYFFAKQEFLTSFIGLAIFTVFFFVHKNMKIQ